MVRINSKTRMSEFKRRIKLEYTLHLMMLLPLVIIIIYRYVPLMGLVLAFQRFNLASFSQHGWFGSEFVGFDNFRFVFGMPEFPRALRNSFYIASMHVVAGMIFPVILALMLNELRIVRLKRFVQSLTYLPFFLSWIILSGILLDILSLSGLVNRTLGLIGIGPIFFLGDNSIFPFTLVFTNLWRTMGWGSIIYLAAITTVNMELYEAMAIDGAGRFKQTLYVTLPALVPIIVLLGTLSLGSILDAGFEQIFNLYNPTIVIAGLTRNLLSENLLHLISLKYALQYDPTITKMISERDGRQVLFGCWLFWMFGIAKSNYICYKITINTN